MAGKRQHTLNENAFESLTPEVSYWLGFITADGSIFTTNGAHILQLLLQPKDKSHIEKFKEFLGSSHKIYEYKNKSCRLQLSSKKIYNDLVSYGIEPRKTYISKSNISNIPDEYKKYFITGLFDGDGSFIVRNKKVHDKRYNRDYYYTQCTIRLLSNVKTLEDIMDYMYKYYNISYSRIEQTKSNYVYKISLYSDRDIRNFYQMYKESPVHLDRKLLKIQDFLNERDSTKDGRRSQ